jgi:serine/threonine protein kinase
MKESTGHTYMYSPPEQVLNNVVEPSTDIWSLGVIFYELFFGNYIDIKTAEKLGLYNN